MDAAPRVRVGRFEVVGLLDGHFRLDGGAMHGTIPRVLWQRVHPPDEQNRIRLGLRSLLVRGPGLTAVVETGLGSHHDDRFGDRFGVVQTPGLIERLAAEGIERDDVDQVVNTHLHWDHAGGNIVATSDGRFEPAFPRAEYVVQRADWDEANAPHERNRGSYRPEDFLTIHQAGQLRLLDGATDLVPGLRVEPVGGHTIAIQIALVSDGPNTLAFLTDMAPTAGHLDYPWIMGYDLYPVETLRAKKRVLPRAIDEDWTVAYVHDPEIAFGRVGRDERGRPVPRSLVD